MAQAMRRPALDPDHPTGHPLRGLIIAQSVGAFNDNAWKQVVALLASAAAASDREAQGRAALAQVVLLVPLMLVSLPAGTLADRVSKRAVILALKWLELALMAAAAVSVIVVSPTSSARALGPNTAGTTSHHAPPRRENRRPAVRRW